MEQDNRGGCLTTLILLFTLVFGSVPAALLTTPATPPTAIAPQPVLALLYGLPDAAQGEAVRAVLEARLAMMAENGLIQDGYTLALSGDQVEVQVAEGALTGQAIAELLQQRGLLEFVDLGAESIGLIPQEGARISSSEGERLGRDAVPPFYPTLLTNAAVTSARATEDNFGSWAVLIELSEAGAAQMGEITAARIGQPLAITLDGVVLIAPTIQASITSPILISGQFSQSQAQRLAVQIGSPSLPAPLVLESMTLLP